ncbi:Uncharacterised protein [Sphingomonas paucimobilis]|nr:Uncharacterised protein [Sphingomonas paucimobilis]
MAQIDLETLRERIRQMDFERGSPEQVALWREDVAEARANLVIEDMTPTIDEDAMFSMMLDEGVPPALMPRLSSVSISPEPARSLPDLGKRSLYISRHRDAS